MPSAHDARPATVEEKSVVAWLLASAPVGATAADLRAQVDGLVVVGGCNCGCPSVDFEHEGQASGAQIVADAVGSDVNGIQVGAIVWSRAGRLSGLEIYAFGDAPAFFLPRLETLKPW